MFKLEMPSSLSSISMCGEQSFLTMAHAFSQVSHALSLCHRPILIHLPASHETCRLWDIHLTEEEQREDGRVKRVKFSEDGSLLAVLRMENLEMWKTSTWECLRSVPCEGYSIDFSPDGLRVLMKNSRENVYAYDVRSGDAQGEIDSMPYSMHDHVRIFWGKVVDKWECAKCESSFLKNGEYWFTDSDRWLWAAEEGVARRSIYIPAEYGGVNDIKSYSSYVAIGCDSGLLVLDMARNLAAV